MPKSRKPLFFYSTHWLLPNPFTHNVDNRSSPVTTVTIIFPLLFIGFFFL